MSFYEVLVGNVGHVHEGNNPVDARREYGVWKALSEQGHGRAAHEPVTLFKDGEPELEYNPPRESDG